MREFGDLVASVRSVARSFYGKPRSTLDVDVAVRGGEKALRKLLDDVAADFYVPVGSAEMSIHEGCSVVGPAERDRTECHRRIADWCLGGFGDGQGVGAMVS